MKLDQLKPDEVCAWIKKQIRKRYGDNVENKSEVYARNGFYFIRLYRGRRKQGMFFTEHIRRRKDLRALVQEWNDR